MNAACYALGSPEVNSFNSVCDSLLKVLLQEYLSKKHPGVECFFLVEYRLLYDNSLFVLKIVFVRDFQNVDS